MRTLNDPCAMPAIRTREDVRAAVAVAGLLARWRRESTERADRLALAEMMHDLQELPHAH